MAVLRRKQMDSVVRTATINIRIQIEDSARRAIGDLCATSSARNGSR